MSTATAPATEDAPETEPAAPAAPTPAAPFRFFDHLTTVRRQQLGPTLVRVTLGGDDLRHYAGGGNDQRVKLFLPRDGQDAPVLPEERGDGWYQAYLAMDESERAVMRTYTVRAARPEQAEVDIDFALHGDLGPASRWATRTAPGDRTALFGPQVEDNGGMDFRPAPDAEWLLLTGDETALPAIGSILETLPPGRTARVFLEVPHPDDRQDLPTAADAEVRWLVRDGHADDADGPPGHGTGGGTGALILDAVRAAALPGGRPYAWIAGEASGVRALRRHLVNDRGYDRRSVNFTGYWRLGKTEDTPAKPGELHS